MVETLPPNLVSGIIKPLQRADNEYDEKLYKEFLDLFYNQLQMPQPSIELLDVKKEKAE